MITNRNLQTNKQEQIISMLFMYMNLKIATEASNNRLCNAIKLKNVINFLKS